jgi:hypothetical protein
MTDEMVLTQTDIYTEGSIYKPSQIKKRSLGGAIFLAAIADYVSPDEQDHESAKRFLYPQTRKWQEQYDWAMALTEGVNPAWLREALDRSKDKWDKQHAQRAALGARRALKRRLKSDRRNRPNEEQRGERIHLDGLVAPAKHRRSFDPSFQPAREARSPRTGDVTPGL